MAKQRQPARPKHVPQRTCIACRKVDAKRGLTRLVRLPDGRVAIDPTGKRAGRGAYLCAERGCWELALKRKAVERALRLERLHDEDRAMLAAHAQTLPQGEASDKLEAASVSAM
ncbi:RNase P modulator RnpM [Kallotenue papyrolyticum]|uniref:RNase P modulator RnpM n=1 Tax=Kallotenue papyrolyticum TaxID=1325125 RepID=UPI000492A966|nr:YlxR family protein [Kallotenue papyrolyticum]